MKPKQRSEEGKLKDRLNDEARKKRRKEGIPPTTDRSKPLIDKPRDTMALNPRLTSSPFD